MMPDSRESHVNQLIAGAQRFNKQDVDSVAFEKGLYSKWMEHNTTGRTRFKDEGLLTVQYKLNQDTRRFTFEHAWLKGPGSGGIVARMRDVDRKANSVADFRFEKAVRIVEWAPHWYGDTLAASWSNLYDAENSVVDSRGNSKPIEIRYREDGLTGLDWLPLFWSQVQSK